MGNTSSTFLNDPVSKIAKPVSKTIKQHKKQAKTKNIPEKKATVRAKKLKQSS